MTNYQDKWLTVVEWRAIETALNQCLAGEEIDSYEDEPERSNKRRAMERALDKVQARYGN